MQKVGNLLWSVGAALATRALLRTISSLDGDALLGPVSLPQRRREWPENLAFLGAGMLVGGVTALLLAPENGEQTRARLFKTAGELGDVAAKYVHRAANELREETNAVRSSPDNRETSSVRGPA